MQTQIPTKNRSHSMARVLLCLATLVLASGCQILPEARQDPTRYYTLAVPSLDATVPSGKAALSVGLRQVEISPYLKKGLLVVRKSETEVSYNDYERWAEPLDASIARLLQTCLQADSQIAVVATPPFSVELHRQYDVIVRVRRADGLAKTSEGSGIRFVAIVEIHSTGDSPKVLSQKVFTAPALPWDGQDYPALAKGLGEAVQLLARDISASLAALPKDQPL